jgi:hypothetical protein
MNADAAPAASTPAQLQNSRTEWRTRLALAQADLADAAARIREANAELDDIEGDLAAARLAAASQTGSAAA